MGSESLTLSFKESAKPGGAESEHSGRMLQNLILSLAQLVGLQRPLMLESEQRERRFVKREMGAQAGLG